ncbi:fatty acyl-CoA hydrolase precursor, medium chain-like [Gastrophryne carolinensis]
MFKIISEFLPMPACVDGIFLRKSAEEILANKESNGVPYLLGVCTHEMGWFLPQLFHMEDVSEGISRESIVQRLQNTPLMDLKTSMIPPVLDEYFGGVTDRFQLRDCFVNVTGDKLFVIPVLTTAKYHRDSGNPVYVYEFHHPPSLLAKTRPDYVKADHTDDLFYVFGGAFLRDGTIFASKATDDEKLLTRTVMRYWANFARNG